MTDQIESHILQKYQIHKKIGSGAYGHVWKVTDYQTKSVYALKKNFDAFSNSTDAQRTYREIMFLRQLKHANIIKLQKTIRAKNDRDIYLVFEHMDVDLHTLIREDGKSTNLQERHKQYIIYQIAKAIFYLHNSNLIHRDLKPSNVLINESCQAKLCDFGLVRLMEEPIDNQQVIMTDYIATRWYRAPEILLGSKDYSKQIDIWALGCLIGEIFLGKAMFPGSSTINQIQKVVAWTGAPSSAQIAKLSVNMNQAISQLFNTRKKLNRSQFFGDKMHPSCLDLINRMLQFDPSKRISIEQVLKHEYLSEFYSEKQIKQIKASKVKIVLHMNDNTRLTVKDYRDIIYSQIGVKTTINLIQKQLTFYNSKTKNIKTQESKSTKKDSILKDKSRHKTLAVDSAEVYVWNKPHSNSTQGKEDSKGIRKDVKSSLQQHGKSKFQTRKKGITLYSKSSSKQTSLSKRKNQFQSIERQVNSRFDYIKKLKPVSRSCSEKQDYRSKPYSTNEVVRSNKKVVLNQCFVNDKIGKRTLKMH